MIEIHFKNFKMIYYYPPLEVRCILFIIYY